MPDSHASFYSLREQYQEERDFRIRAENRGGRILILAPHGGGIEPGTSELARAIAGENLSYYLFEVFLPSAHESQKLHITSTRFDEPRCVEMIGGFQTSLAIHGCVGEAPLIRVGGRDQDLKEKLITGLFAKGHPVQLGAGEYAGSFSMNICNRTAARHGVQLELSSGLRRLLFVEWRTREGRKATTGLFAKLISDIRDVIA